MVEDIDALLPEPSGAKATEVAVYNAFRVLGSANIRPADLQHLRLASALVNDRQAVNNMSGPFRDGIRNILGVFSRVGGETEEVQLLWGALVERLREVLESDAGGRRRISARVKQKRLRRRRQ